MSWECSTSTSKILKILFPLAENFLGICYFNFHLFINLFIHLFINIIHIIIVINYFYFIVVYFNFVFLKFSLALVVGGKPNWRSSTELFLGINNEKILVRKRSGIGAPLKL